MSAATAGNRTRRTKTPNPGVNVADDCDSVTARVLVKKFRVSTSVTTVPAPAS